jgi:hypothetical protein
MLFLLGSYLERLGVLVMILGHGGEKRLRDPGHAGIPDLFLYRLARLRGFGRSPKQRVVPRTPGGCLDPETMLPSSSPRVRTPHLNNGPASANAAVARTPAGGCDGAGNR